jgi:hypothetical protein
VPSARDEEAARAAVERFARQLVVTWKAVLLYPSGSAIPTSNAQLASMALGKAIDAVGSITFSVAKDGLFYEGEPLLAGLSGADEFALAAYQRTVAEIGFTGGTDASSLLDLLERLKTDPSDAASGDALSWEGLSAAIEVVTTRLTLIDSLPDAGAGTLTDERVQEMVDQVSGAALMQWIGNLAGARAVTVGGSPSGTASPPSSTSITTTPLLRPVRKPTLP